MNNQIDIDAGEIFGDDPLKVARRTIEMQLVEINLLRSQLTESRALVEKLKWKTMDYKPTIWEAGADGHVSIMSKDGKIGMANWNEVNADLALYWRSSAMDTIPKITVEEPDPIRVEFEKWAEKDGQNIGMINGEYAYPYTAGAWNIWKAAKGV